MVLMLVTFSLNDANNTLIFVTLCIYRLSNQQQLTRALFYMAQVFVGFFLMLIFMTYNGYLMAATVIGAGVGFFYFGGDSLSSSTKALSCH
jgi:copper transporter 1